MRIATITSLLILGLIIGMPLIIAGKNYFVLLLALSLGKKILIVLMTVVLGVIVEGYLKNKINK